MELISVPLKKPSDVDVIKPLTNIIKSTYNTAGNQKDYADEVGEFSRLRNQALWRAFEKYESSLEVIYKYYDQLCALEGKIPAHEMQIPFKWKDAFDRTIFGSKLSLTLCNFAYEKMCVLFNIAALQSSIASTQSMESDEGLKLAAKLFQQAAGIFNFLKGNVMLAIQQDPTPDMSPETLTALSTLMLAQAQEIFVHKAIHDSMKEVVIAKLASQAEEMYAEASKIFQKDIFRSFWDKDWLPLIIGKQSGYKAMAEFYQAAACKNKKAIGEEIARLDYAVDLFQAAGLRSRKPELFEDYLNRAQRRLAEAQKDNDFIYHERVPDMKNLEPIGKANVAKFLSMTTPMSTNFKDIFAELLPVSVHHALSSYEIRRNDLVNTEISKLRELTQVLNTVLTSLNLPAAIEDTSGTEVPQSLIEKANFVREAGGIAGLEAMMNELPELLQRNRDILDETEKMLREENQSDKKLREQFKERWKRIPSDKLTQQFTVNAQKYRSIIDNAVAADSTIRQKFETHREGMKKLSMNETRLAKAIPSGNAVKESSTVTELQKLMEEVETLKAERDVIESEIKSATADMKSVFLSALAQDGAIDEPNLSVENIGKTYGSYTTQIRESATRQENLISAIQTAHAAFISEQSGSGGSREAMMCKLAAAYDAFKEIKNNLQEGAKFYNDLTQLLVVFQNKVSDFCFARKTEKEELLKDLTYDMSHLGPGMTPSVPQLHSATPEQTQGGAQLPYPTQYQGGMPLPYGATPAVPYPTYVPPPPMPTTYNPYATMPYPTQQQQQPYGNPAYPYQQQPQQPPQQQPQPGYSPYATFPRYPGAPQPPQNPW